MNKLQANLPDVRELKTFSIRELQMELNRRSQPQPSIPQPIVHPDWTKLIEMCQQYIDAEPDFDNDWPQYIFETAIEAIYGKTIWRWISERK